MGMFFSPNQAGVMNSLPPDQRGAGAGMLNTFQNSASVLSIGVFFTLITLGLAAALPGHLYARAGRPGRPAAAAAAQSSHLPPIGSLFAAFLGLQPDAAAARADAACRAPDPGHGPLPDRQGVLPPADLGAVR